MNGRYLLDTHAVVFWQSGEHMPVVTSRFLDHEAMKGNVMISAISFWEIALLVKKGRLDIKDVKSWKDDILDFSGARLIYPVVEDMMSSVHLPDHHSDPFDRLLISQAIREKSVLVSRDSIFSDYDVTLLWRL